MQTESMNIYVEYPQICTSLLDGNQRKQIYPSLSWKAMKITDSEQRAIKHFERWGYSAFLIFVGKQQRSKKVIS